MIGNLHVRTAGALADTFFPADLESGSPSGRDIVPGALEALLPTLPVDQRRELIAVLLIFEHASLLTHRGRFSRLDADSRADCVDRWMRSRFPMQRIIYRSLRSLLGMLYYQHPDTWEAIGYPGPQVERGHAS